MQVGLQGNAGMTCSEGLSRSCRSLYPRIKPFDQRMLDVGDGHSVYVEQCGSPDGYPVLVLHGGPGGGCSHVMRQFFDPRFYRAVLFDQRGCGRSRPYACVEANTTHHLIRDIESIRKALGIDRWILFGGSWGAALALLYSQRHSDRATHLVLRGVFLMTPSELDWFYGGGAAAFWPDQWSRFIDPIPTDEHGDLIAAYNRRLFCGDMDTETRFGRSWFEWENALSSLQGRKGGANCRGGYARAFARLENHYFMNGGFLDSDRHILEGMGKLRGVGGTVVHGRYDMVCPPGSAFELVRKWPSAKLKIVQAGHALSEPAIASSLVEEMDELRSALGPVLAASA